MNKSENKHDTYSTSACAKASVDTPPVALAKEGIAPNRLFLIYWFATSLDFQVLILVTNNALRARVEALELAGYDKQ